jgi:hypothetical protein
LFRNRSLIQIIVPVTVGIGVGEIDEILSASESDSGTDDTFCIIVEGIGLERTHVIGIPSA